MIIFILLAILLVCVLILIFKKLIPTKTGQNPTETIHSIQPIQQIETNQPNQTNQTNQTTQIPLQDEIYLKFKKLLSIEGISNKCIDCLYSKLRSKHTPKEFEHFFKNLKKHNSEETNFQKDFFKFGELCSC